MNTQEAVLKLFSGRLALALLKFGAIAGFTQALGAGAIGSYFLFQTVVGLVGIPGDLGISATAEQQLSSSEPPGEVISTTVLVKAGLLLPWLLGLLAAGPYVEQYIGVEGILPFALAGLVAGQVQNLSLRLLSGQLRVEQTALLKVAGRFSWAVVGAGLVVAGWGATAVIAAHVVGNVVTALGAVARLDLTLDRPRLRRARSLLSFGRYVFIGSVGGFVYSWMDVALLRLFVPPSLIGAYELAWRVASLSMMLTQAIRRALFPQISSWYADGDLDEIEAAFRRWLQMPLYLTIPAFAGAVVLGKDVLGTLFGTGVVVAYPVLVVFMVEKVLRSVHMILSPSLFAMDQPELAYRGSIASVVANLGLNLLLIPVFGLVGAAVATTLSSVVSVVVNAAYVSRFVQIQPPWHRIGWSALSAAAMAVCVALVRPSLPAGWPRVLLGVGTGVAVFLGLLLVRSDIRMELNGMLVELQERPATDE